MTPWLADFFIWLQGRVYTWTNRVYFTEAEVEYLIDIVDIWVEAYPSLAEKAEDDEVQSLHENMSTAMDVRNKLWRQLNG